MHDPTGLPVLQLVAPAVQLHVVPAAGHPVSAQQAPAPTICGVHEPLPGEMPLVHEQ